MLGDAFMRCLLARSAPLRVPNAGDGLRNNGTLEANDFRELNADATDVTESRAVELPEVKGMMMPITRVRLRARGASETVAEFRQWASQLPEVMRGMPIVLDAHHHTACSSLMDVAREYGLCVLAVEDGKLAPTAAACGLPVLDGESLMTGRAPRQEAPATSGEAETPAPAAAPAADRGTGRQARVVHSPVRSGQQIYAEGADLIVLGSVSAGAEVIADGHVHIYGVLRGRAIAGARGDLQARIFCQRFEAELVACAGTYDVAENLREELRGHAVQVWLHEGSLQFARLDVATSL